MTRIILGAIILTTFAIIDVGDLLTIGGCGVGWGLVLMGVGKGTN